MDNFWLDDYKILYINNNYLKFFPDKNMTKIEQLNAITRFSIYLFILSFMFNINDKWLLLPIFLIIFTIVLFKIHSQHLLKLKNELGNKKEDVINLDLTEKELTNIQHQDKEDLWDMGKKKENKTEKKEYFDAYDKNIIEGVKETCTKPTQDNPFMNFMISDYKENPDKLKACTNVDKEIDDNFNHNLYRDIDDLFERKNSQRQFYTMPNTQNPNSQKEFAEWLYKVPEICKTDQEHCLKYEDLRYIK